MAKQIEVIICGVNVALDGWMTRLKASDQLRVTRLQQPLALAIDNLKLLTPDVVIYEMKDDDSLLSAALLEKQTGLKLIGLDLERNIVKVSSGSERPALNTKELLRVVGIDNDG